MSITTKASPIATLIVALALAPSALLFAAPIVEADPLALFAAYRGADAGSLAFVRDLLHHGRLLFFLHAWLFGHLPAFPGASHVLGAVYLFTTGIFLALLWRALSSLLQSSFASAVAVGFVASHHYFLEARFWSGHQVVLAMTVQLIGWEIMRHCGDRPARAALGALATTLVALNIHQSGAMLLPGLAALEAAARPAVSLRRLFIPLTGFMAAAVIYALLFALLGHVEPLALRANGSVVLNSLRFAYWFPVSAFTLLPAGAYRHPAVGWFLATAIVAVPMAAVGWRGRGDRAGAARHALPLLVLPLLVAPNIVTNGYFPARVLLPPLIVLVGWVALTARHLPPGGRRAGTGLAAAVLVALFGVHAAAVWGLVQARAGAYTMAATLRAELARVPLAPGDHIELIVGEGVPAALDWGDTAQSIWLTRWGVGALAGAPVNEFAAEAGAPPRDGRRPGHRRLVRRTAPDTVRLDPTTLLRTERAIVGAALPWGLGRE